MTDEMNRRMQDAVRLAFVVLDLGKLDPATLSLQTAGTIEKLMVDVAIEGLGLTNPTEMQRILMREAVRNALLQAVNGRNNGVTACVFPKEG